MFVFVRERQQGRGRGMDTKNPKRAPHWQQRAPGGARTHQLRDHALAEVRCLIDWATQGPPKILSFLNKLPNVVNSSQGLIRPAPPCSLCPPIWDLQSQPRLLLLFGFADYYLDRRLVSGDSQNVDVSLQPLQIWGRGTVWLYKMLHF